MTILFRRYMRVKLCSESLAASDGVCVCVCVCVSTATEFANAPLELVERSFVKIYTCDSTRFEYIIC